MTLDPTRIEPEILPLVEAFNETGILNTFSSCRGHYDPAEQEWQDRNKADVRFYPSESTTDETVEAFLNYLILEFNKRESISPITISACKLYCPDEENTLPDYCYVVTLKPIDRFDNPENKRGHTDHAIAGLTQIVKEYAKQTSRQQCV